MQYRKKPFTVEAVTFDDLVAHGIAQCKADGRESNIVNGMPWSFTFHGATVTHENDGCYIVGKLGSITPGEIIPVTETGGMLRIMLRADFHREFEPVDPPIPPDLVPTGAELADLTPEEREALGLVWTVTRIPGENSLGTQGWVADNGEHLCHVWFRGKPSHDEIGANITETLRNSGIIAQNQQITIIFVGNNV